MTTELLRLIGNKRFDVFDLPSRVYIKFSEYGKHVISGQTAYPATLETAKFRCIVPTKEGLKLLK